MMSDSGGKVVQGFVPQILSATVVRHSSYKETLKGYFVKLAVKGKSKL